MGKRFDDKIENAIFVPCPPERVEELMEGLQKYLTQDNVEAKVVQCALVHHQFETIHPFSDGNGRVGRLLIVLHMIKLGLLSAPLIYPSVFFEQTKNDYCACLQTVRDENDWEGWITYFAFATAQACEDTLRFTRTVINLQRHLHSQIS
ncbi:MAG: Fic family protein [Leptolyngbyaceae cyanobacterium RU_5_1]|nr:Fic family protein [Leptolyngbyaceae cyanobacterium RU_5_1]